MGSLRNLQIIAKNSLPNYADVQRLITGASIKVRGELAPSQGKGQSWEVVADDLTIVGASDETYPLQKKGHTPEFLGRSRISVRAQTSSVLSFVCEVAWLMRFTPFLGSRTLLSQHANYYGERLRRRGRAFSGDLNRCEKSAANEGG